MSEYIKFNKADTVEALRDRLVKAVVRVEEEKARVLREEAKGSDNDAWYCRKKQGQWQMEAQGLREQLAFLASMGLEEAAV